MSDETGGGPAPTPTPSIPTIVIGGDQPPPAGPPAGGETPGAWQSFKDGFVKGDFSDNSSWWKVAGQVVGGIVPYYGQAADARDTIAAVKGVWDGKDGAWVDLGLAGIGWVPLAGDALKGSIRVGRKAVKVGAEVGSELGEQTLKHADDAAKKLVPDIPTTPPKDFTGTVRGAKVTLPGVTMRTIEYVKRAPADAEKLRAAFDSSVRGSFVKDLVNDPEKLAKLRAAGLDDVDIAIMRDGRVPEGFQVHHKLPLDDGGTNDLDNLVLIENEPYHKAITNAQRELTGGMKEGEKKVVEFPVPDGFVYPPKPLE